MPSTLQSLTVIMAAAVAAPILCEAIPRFRVPVVVLELMLGIVVGPQVLDLAGADEIVSAFSMVGMALLFFMAGYEVPMDKISGRPLLLGAGGWALSLVLAFTATALLIGAGEDLPLLVVGVAVCTTT